MVINIDPRRIATVHRQCTFSLSLPTFSSEFSPHYHLTLPPPLLLVCATSCCCVSHLYPAPVCRTNVPRMPHKCPMRMSCACPTHVPRISHAVANAQVHGGGPEHGVGGGAGGGPQPPGEDGAGPRGPRRRGGHDQWLAHGQRLLLLRCTKVIALRFGRLRFGASSVSRTSSALVKSNEFGLKRRRQAAPKLNT